MNSAAIRTSGDGTESPEASLVEAKKSFICLESSSESAVRIDKLGKEYLTKQFQSTSSILYNPSSSENKTLNYPLPIEPNGKRFYLIPRIAPSKSLPASLKNRKPTLILMEPYRACVNPIVPYQKNENRVKITDRNNLNIATLVKHMKASKQSESSILKGDGDDKIMALKKERDYFESQLSFQTQVNCELKSLLVHCLGEDIQTKVNNLTEDKMKIAESHLADTEKLEQATGLAEVWRSKFLASSLMVEELAKVKTALAQKNSKLVASSKQMLGTFETLRFQLLEIFDNLKFLSGAQESKLRSQNVTDLTFECLNITQQLVLNSGIRGLPQRRANTDLDQLTEAEKTALDALTGSNESNTMDEAFRAVCNKAQQEYRHGQRQSESDFEVIESN